MNKKNYVELAKALYSVRPYEFADDFPQWEKTVIAVADGCAADNPLFNRGKFMKACNGD
jgi:hypothetical protein